LRQTFQRRVLQKHLEADPPVSLLLAIPDHPWVDAERGAAVRIAMTVAGAGEHDGILSEVVSERSGGSDAVEVETKDRRGRIAADLRIGANVAAAGPLRANSGLSCPGVKLHGAGFIVTPEQAVHLGLGQRPGLERHLRHYRNGRDLTQQSRGAMVIDLFGLEAEEVRVRFPEVYQWVYERVKPERDQNNRAVYRDFWWVFGEPRANFRPALVGLRRYISTVETAKHRVFTFLDENVLLDNKLVNIALEDAYFLGVLSSRVHIAWALTAGSLLEDRPVYVKTTCFEPFPFPDTEATKDRIRTLAEALDAHRKARQAEHTDLTLTGMYNVHVKLKAREELSVAERVIHDQGLVSVLADLPHVRFTAAGYGPLLAVAAWREGCKEPIYLVSNLDLAEEALYWYQKRYGIETFFSDQKSRGFHLHQSHLSDPKRLARLMIAACLAYVWLVFLGRTAQKQGWMKAIHREKRCDLSLFQLGIALLNYLLLHSFSIPANFLAPPSYSFATVRY
jgi:hypothetical protein